MEPWEFLSVHLVLRVFKLLRSMVNKCRQKQHRIIFNHITVMILHVCLIYYSALQNHSTAVMKVWHPSGTFCETSKFQYYLITLNMIKLPLSKLITFVYNSGLRPGIYINILPKVTTITRDFYLSTSDMAVPSCQHSVQFFSFLFPGYPRSPVDFLPVFFFPSQLRLLQINSAGIKWPSIPAVTMPQLETVNYRMTFCWRIVI